MTDKEKIKELMKNEPWYWGEEVDGYTDDVIEFIETLLKEREKEIYKNMRKKVFGWHGSGELMVDDYVEYLQSNNLEG